MDYATWRGWDIAAKDQYSPQAGRGPDRRNEGSIAAGVSYLGQHFGAAASAQLIGLSFQAASDFMNFCEDLKGLAVLQAANTAWNTLIVDLQSIVKKDVGG